MNKCMKPQPRGREQGQQHWQGGGFGAIVRRAQARGRHLPPWLLRTRGLVQRRAALRGRTQPPVPGPQPSPSAGWCMPGPWCAVGCAGSVVHGGFVWCTVAVRGARSRSWVHGRCAWRTARGLRAWRTVVVPGPRPAGRARCRSQHPARGGRGDVPRSSRRALAEALPSQLRRRAGTSRQIGVSAPAVRGREGALCK